MNRKQFRRIVGFILTAILVVGTLIMAATTAAAHFGNSVEGIDPDFPKAIGLAMTAGSGK